MVMNTEQLPVILKDDSALIINRNNIIQKMMQFKVKTAEDVSVALNLLGNARDWLKESKTTKDSFTKPLKLQVKWMDGQFDDKMQPMEHAERTLTKEIQDYRDKERREAEAERVKQAEVARLAFEHQQEMERQAQASQAKAEAEAAEAEQRRLDAEKAGDAAAMAQAEAEANQALFEAQQAAKKADKYSTLIPEPLTTIVPDAPKTVIGSDGKKAGGFRESWEAEVIDASLVPPEFRLGPDMVKLRKYAGAMKEQAKVPGVRFYRRDIPVT